MASIYNVVGLIPVSVCVDLQALNMGEQVGKVKLCDFERVPFLRQRSRSQKNCTLYVGTFINYLL